MPVGPDQQQAYPDVNTACEDRCIQYSWCREKLEGEVRERIEFKLAAWLALDA
jgi:hypothetical protein